jgi:hypothetical protein
MSFSNQTIDFEALLYALAQQTEPLPKDLQQKLTKMSRSLRENNTDDYHQLRGLIQQFPALEIAYKRALEEWDKNYASQERAKCLDATFHRTSGLDDLFINSVLSTEDWVISTKKIISSRRSPKQRSQFLKRGDRVLTFTSGGAFLGVLIAQIPGAIIGGLFAGIYAWFSFPAVKTDTSR